MDVRVITTVIGAIHVYEERQENIATYPALIIAWTVNLTVVVIDVIQGIT